MPFSTGTPIAASLPAVTRDVRSSRNPGSGWSRMSRAIPTASSPLRSISAQARALSSSMVNSPSYRYEGRFYHEKPHGPMIYNCARTRSATPMKIVIAPDSYKGSIYASDAARAMEDGVRRVLPDAETVLVPVADGGDGTLETLVETSGGRIITSEVTGPLGEPVSAQWGAMGDGVTAVAEMARTVRPGPRPAGGPRPPERDHLRPGRGHPGGPSRRDSGRFILGIGGSATNDAGAGMAQALGVRLLRRRRRRSATRRRGPGEARPHRRVGPRPQGVGRRLRRGMRRQQPTHRGRRAHRRSTGRRRARRPP